MIRGTRDRRHQGRHAAQCGLLVFLAASAADVSLGTAQTIQAESGPQSFWATVQQKERSIFFAALENGIERTGSGPWSRPTRPT